MEELTVEEIIRYAIRVEQVSFAFYRMASEILRGNELQFFTDELADKEVEHIVLLKDLLKENSISSEDLIYLVSIDTSLFNRIIHNQNIPVQANPLNILYIALEREKDTLENYEMLLTLTDLNKKIIDTLISLKTIEKNNVRKISEKISIYQR